MKKNALISNLFNNLNLPNDRVRLWELQYQNLAEKCDADFVNFSITDNGSISKNYAKVLSDRYNEEQTITKMNQLSMLDEIDKCFAQGYEWVFAMDADIVINPNADFDIKKRNKNVVYFASVNKNLSGRLEFLPNLKNDFLEKHSLKYGNQGVFLINKIVWNSIKNTLVDFEEITKYSKSNSIKTFFNRGEQEIVSMALTLNNIAIDQIPNKENLFLHFVGNHIQEYKDTYEIDDVGFAALLEAFVNSIDVEVSKKNLAWLPLLFHYLNLTSSEKQKLY